MINDHRVCFICVPQVQKLFGESAVFSSLTPGRLYRFAVRTEKESFTDSSPVTINITAGKHTQHTYKCTHSSASFPITVHIVFSTTAPSPVEMSLINKTTSSIHIGWSRVRGVLDRFILSVKNKTFSQEQVISNQEARSVSDFSASPQMITVLWHCY